MTTHTAETLPRIKIPFIVTRARVVAFLFLCLIPHASGGVKQVSPVRWLRPLRCESQCGMEEGI